MLRAVNSGRGYEKRSEGFMLPVARAQTTRQEVSPPPSPFPAPSLGIYVLLSLLFILVSALSTFCLTLFFFICKCAFVFVCWPLSDADKGQQQFMSACLCLHSTMIPEHFTLFTDPQKGGTSQYDITCFFKELERTFPQTEPTSTTDGKQEHAQHPIITITKEGLASVLVALLHMYTPLRRRFPNLHLILVHFPNLKYLPLFSLNKDLHSPVFF